MWTFWGYKFTLQYYCMVYGSELVKHKEVLNANEETLFSFLKVLFEYGASIIATVQVSLEQ